MRLRGIAIRGLFRRDRHAHFVDCLLLLAYFGITLDGRHVVGTLGDFMFSIWLMRIPLSIGIGWVGVFWLLASLVASSSLTRYLGQMIWIFMCALSAWLFIRENTFSDFYVPSLVVFAIALIVGVCFHVARFPMTRRAWRFRIVDLLWLMTLFAICLGLLSMRVE